MLEDVLKSYRKKASIVDWKKYNPNELFFEYIKHENDELGECFYAGIVCRFWGYAGKIYVQCNRHIPFEECYDCIIDSIKYVLKNRVWEKPDNSLYMDKTGPDKAMHIAMKRQKAIMLSKYTANRRLSNFNTLSIDAAHENYNDAADGLFNLGSKDDYLKTYILEFFEKDEYLNGIFLDVICYSNIKYNVKNVIKYIKNITNDDLNYYITSYNVDRRKFIKLINEIKNTSNNLLELKLNSLLYKLRKEEIFIND